ncbi:MAG: hypothetical protein A2231_05510 [Candidatus Firestonebacteria bacterium RIFOXYA2_FULL_40_8]|nr:MAG: hypothetical protein A2231_05510 [Candidatus Firestonebacteria bacterium RIFOXYA2_FULL_40_8]
MKKGIAVIAGVVIAMSGFLCAADKPVKAKAKAKVEKAEPAEKTEEAAQTLKKGDKMELIKIDKGETVAYGASGDSSKEFVVSLSKEKAEKGKMYSTKAVLVKGGKGLPIFTRSGGLLKGKRGNWKDYDSLVIKYILEGDKPYSTGMIIADEESYGENYANWNYSSHCDKQVTLQPGENILSIDLSALVSNGGRTLDLGNMRTVSFYGKEREEDCTIYFQSVYVEKE